MERKTARIGELRVSWQEAGAGVPVVLIHGIPTSPRLWRHVVPRLDARALAFEMIGYGGSIEAGRGRDISLKAQAGYLLDWLDALKIERAVFAGHDLGGGVAQIAAVRAPERCAGLFLTNAVCYDSWPIPEVKAMRAMGPLMRRIPDALFKSVYAMFMRMGHDDAEKAREAAKAHLPFYLEADGAAAMIRQMDSLDTQDTLEIAGDLPRLKLPARIAWGTGDRFQKIKYGERLAKDLAAPLARIDGAKHFTPEDHPGTVAGEIAALVEMVKG